MNDSEVRQLTGGQGFVYDYVRYVSKRTYAPVEFHIGSAISIVSATLGDRLKYLAWEGLWVPNLYILLLGPSGGGKSTALRMARKVYQMANPGVELLPKDVTLSALFNAFNEHTARLWCHSELAQFLATLDNQYNRGLRETLTDLYDYEELSSMTMKDGIRIVHPALNILAASNPEWLTAYVRENDVMGGFLPRFTYFMGISKGEEPQDWDRNPSNDYGILGNQLTHYCNSACGRVDFSDVRTSMTNYMRAHRDYSAEMRSRDSRLAPFLERYGHMFIKLCVLMNASMNGSSHIEMNAVETAGELTNWLRNNFERLVLDQFAFDKSSRGTLAVRKALADAGGALSRSELQRNLRGAITSTRDFTFAVENALDLGEMEQYEEETGGRPRVCYRLKS